MNRISARKKVELMPRGTFEDAVAHEGMKKIIEIFFPFSTDFYNFFTNCTHFLYILTARKMTNKLSNLISLKVAIRRLVIEAKLKA